jgi:hypothetical protein
MDQGGKRKAVLRQAQDGPERGRRAEIYKWIKIGGLLSFLPFVLAAGPVAAFFLGDYLEKRFGLGGYASAALMAAGFLASIAESVKIIKAAIKMQGKP